MKEFIKQTSRDIQSLGEWGGEIFEATFQKVVDGVNWPLKRFDQYWEDREAREAFEAHLDRHMTNHGMLDMTFPDIDIQIIVDNQASRQLRLAQVAMKKAMAPKRKLIDVVLN